MVAEPQQIVTEEERKLWAPSKIVEWVAYLEKGTPFTYTNIGGDGEFLTMLGWPGTNSDGHQSTQEKGEAMARVILEPRLTFHGYNPGRPNTNKLLEAEQWLRRHGVNVPRLTDNECLDPDFGGAEINVRWVHKEVIASSNSKGRLGPMLRVLKERPLLVVGMEGLDSFVDRLGGESVLIPAEVGWEAIDEIEQQVRTKLDTMPADTVVTWGLGYLSKVLTWRLAPDYLDATQIDVGACWDAYCGILNRHAYKKPEWQEAMKKNLSLLGETS
jgi:hypothetical protein